MKLEFYGITQNYDVMLMNKMCELSSFRNKIA